MSLRAKAKAAVDKAFKSADSMAVDINLVSIQGLEYDPNNPEQDGETVENWIRAIEVKYKKHEIDGEQIKAFDRGFIFDPDQFDEAKLLDHCLIDSVKYEVISISPIQQDVLHKIQVRSYALG